jgi:catechol 2,3-dioxygenase-like lactoylglutathione lyase family enzyme
MNKMKAEISLITIWTDNIEKMKAFYSNVLGFRIKSDLGKYVEFENEGVRFSVCERAIMLDHSKEYEKKASGQSFELAFPCDGPEDVDKSYEKLISMGALSVKEPTDMPWNQRTALFSDPDGNIHEIFANL